LILKKQLKKNNMKTNNHLEEEVFCLKYELNTFAEGALHTSGERWVKGFLHHTTEKQHQDRYEFVCDYVKDKNVLDIACGSGYGSYLMATKGGAKTIVGVDLDADALRYAKHRYNHEKIQHICEDATKFTYDKKFDVIVSFETIEHIPNYTDFIENLGKLLTDNGTLIISTPINRRTTTELRNPYHVIEWSFRDFQDLWENQFHIEGIYLQNTALIRNHIPIVRMKNFVKSIMLNEKGSNAKRTVFGKAWEKFDNQYDMNACVGGFQTLVLHKK